MEPEEVKEELTRHGLDQGEAPTTQEECAEGPGAGGAAAARTAWSAEDVVELAEKYFDRVDAAQLLELLPAHTPVASLLRFFKIVLEYGAAQKRNLQVRYFQFVHSRHSISLSISNALLPHRSSTSCCEYEKCRFAQITNSIVGTRVLEFYVTPTEQHNCTAVITENVTVR